MAAEIRDVRELQFSLAIEEKKRVFTFSAMDIEFDMLIRNDKNALHWDKEGEYLVCGNTYVKFNYTVAKVFNADNLKHTGYVVLEDVKKDDTQPQILAYFSESNIAQYIYASLEKAAGYVFYLEDKKYHLIAKSAIEESPKERKKGKLEQFSDFFKKRQNNSFLSRSSTMPTVETFDFNRKRRSGER